MFLAANGIGCRGMAVWGGGDKGNIDKQKQNPFSHTTKAPLSILHHQIPVCAGLTKVSLDCATARTFEILTDGAPDDFRDGAPMKKKRSSGFRNKLCQQPGKGTIIDAAEPLAHHDTIKQQQLTLRGIPLQKVNVHQFTSRGDSGARSHCLGRNHRLCSLQR